MQSMQRGWGGGGGDGKKGVRSVAAWTFATE